MTWIRLEDGFPEHPKVIAAGPEGLAVHVRALCYAGRNLTNGFLPAEIVPTLVVGTNPTIDWPGRLTALGLWEHVEGGYRIHDFLHYNPSRKTVLERRRLRAIAGRRGGQVAQAKRKKTQANAQANGQANAKQTGKQNSTPTPTPKERKTGARARARARDFLSLVRESTGGEAARGGSDGRAPDRVTNPPGMSQPGAVDVRRLVALARAAIDQAAPLPDRPARRVREAVP